MPRFIDISGGAPIAAAADARAALGVTRTGGPRMVLILDDTHTSHNTALAEAESRGQRLNLAVCTNQVGSSADYMTWTQVVRAAQAGHGIMAHSVSHASMTTRTSEQLADELDDSKAFIETYVGQPVKDWVYPNSARDTRTLSAGYIRYRRQFSGAFGTEPWRVKWWQPKPAFCGRYGWNSGNHAAVLAEVEAAAAAEEDIFVYTHSIDGSNFNTPGITTAEFTELLDLALTLGMEIVPSDHLGDSQYLVDPSFEHPESFGANFEVVLSTAGSYTAEIVTATPADDVPGTQVLHLAMSTTSGHVIVRQRKLVPLRDWHGQLEPATLTARVKTNITGGAGGASVKLSAVLRDGTIGTGGQAKASATYTAATWSDEREVFTEALSSYGGYAYLLVEYRLVNASGDAWFDHAQLVVGDDGKVIA